LCVVVKRSQAKNSILSCLGESLAFLLTPRLVKSTFFIKETGSIVATLHAGAPYYLLIEKARAIHMPYACAYIGCARVDNYECDVRTCRAKRAAAQALSHRLCQIIMLVLFT